MEDNREERRRKEAVEAKQRNKQAQREKKET